MYLKMYCFGSKTSIFGAFELSRSLASYLITTTAFVTIPIFLLFLYFSKVVENKTMIYFETQKASPMSYALKIKNLPNGKSA